MWVFALCLTMANCVEGHHGQEGHPSQGHRRHLRGQLVGDDIEVYADEVPVSLSLTLPCGCCQSHGVMARPLTADQNGHVFTVFDMLDSKAAAICPPHCQ